MDRRGNQLIKGEDISGRNKGSTEIQRDKPDSPRTCPYDGNEESVLDKSGARLLYKKKNGAE